MYNGEGVEEPYDLYHGTVRTKRVGDTVTHSYAAPGTGYVTWRITRIDATGVYGVKIADTLRIMEGYLL